jgi:hypothetical protein
VARAHVIAVALVAASLAAGCGGDDDDGVFEEGSGPRETVTETQDGTTGTEPSGGGQGEESGGAASVPDACELLPDAEVAKLLGSVPKPEKKDGQTLDEFPLSQCVWEEGKAGVAVAVVGSTQRYRQHEQRGVGEPVKGLGEAALVEPGTSLEDRGGTRGRTLFVRDGDRTLVVALNGGDRDVSVDAIVDLARDVHARLPD